MVILHVKPCGRAGRLPSVTRAHIIDWVRSPNFISWFLKLSCEGAYHLVKRSIRAVTVTYLDKLWKVRISVLCIHEVICIRTCTGINKRMIEYTTGVINLKLITPFCALQHTFYVGSKPKSVFYENLEFVLYGNLATVAII
mgnify:FL=1